MKKLILISLLFGAMPLAMMAQDDDLYFVPKKNKAETVKTEYNSSRNTYYSGSNRSVDEYNRMQSRYEVVGNDSTSDIIDFSAEKGVYPDSLMSEDYELTKKLQRFDDYDISDNAAFWAGYQAGRDDWGWHSPWYYRTYGWYGWHSPWMYHYAYDPWFYGFGGWYGGPWSYWYDPWYWDSYAYGWGPYWTYYGWNYYYPNRGGSRYYAHTGNTGSIDRFGSTRAPRRGTLSGSRMTSLRNRTVGTHGMTGSGTRYVGGSNARSGGYSSGNSVRSSSGNFSGSRSSSYSGGGSSYSGGGASRSSGGSVGSGGGGRSGGGSLGGRR